MTTASYSTSPIVYLSLPSIVCLCLSKIITSYEDIRDARIGAGVKSHLTTVCTCLFLSFVKWYREGYKHHCHHQVNYQDKKENKPRFLISCYMFAVRSYISGWLNRTIEECILEKKDFCKHVNWNGQDFELRAIERSTLSERNVHLYLYRKYTYSSQNVRCHWYVRYKYDFGLRMFCSVSSFPWRHKSEI